MWKPWTILCLSLLGLGLAALPARAVETRIQSFSLACDGHTKTFAYNATGFAASVSRLMQGADVALSETRGGINFLRFQMGAGATRVLLELGHNQVSARAQMTGFMQVTTSAAGTVPFRVIGSCNGGGAIQGFATVFFF